MAEASIPTQKTVRLENIKCSEVQVILKKYDLIVVIIIVARIIYNEILVSRRYSSSTYLRINTKYRGGHGGYWAIVNDDRNNCGVTAHLVDRGINSGGILYQQTISPILEDNFITYLYLQIGEGITLMRKATEAICNYIMLK